MASMIVVIIGSGNVTSLVPCHYLKLWWLVINWTHRNKLHWNFIQNTVISIQQNVFENVFCKMAAILSPPQCVNQCPLSIHEGMERLNSLAPGRCGNHFKSVISKHMLWIKFMGTSCEIALRRMPQNTFDNKPTLVQVMAWCSQATSRYLSQCWPRSLSPYGVTRPQWVNSQLSMSLLSQHTIHSMNDQGPLLLTWINFNPIIDK